MCNLFLSHPFVVVTVPVNYYEMTDYWVVYFFFEDLLTVTPHTPTSEPVKVDKTDGQWYTHDGVDVKETQSRKGKFLLYMFL